ncbi:MAG: hypothetical protein OEZ22_11070 [Spirochaetia bacterium]|nr:hypothetical protein [Spirochaetia bacterium]
MKKITGIFIYCIFTTASFAGSLYIGSNIRYSKQLNLLSKWLPAGYETGLNGIYELPYKNILLNFDMVYGQYFHLKAKESRLQYYSFNTGPEYLFSVNNYFNPYVGIYFGSQYMSLYLLSNTSKENTFKPVFSTSGGFQSDFNYFSTRFYVSYKLFEISSNLQQNINTGFSALFKINFSSENKASDVIPVNQNSSFIKIIDVNLNSIFSSRYTMYNEAGIGKITIKNIGPTKLYDVWVETNIQTISAKPSSTKIIDSIAPDEQLILDIPVHLNEKILEKQESKDLPINFKIIYKAKEGIFSFVNEQTILIQNKKSQK